MLINSNNSYKVLPEEKSSNRLDGYGVQQSSDPGQARYFEGFTGYGKPNATLDVFPQRPMNNGAKSDVTFNAESTVLLNGNRAVSIGWGFTVKSKDVQTVRAPVIMKSTSEFHNNAVENLIQKILAK
jgi:hypothetical protein